MTKRIGIAAVFLVGCAVGGVSSQLVVPKASAQQAATLTKWEYRCVPAMSDGVEEAANRMGGEGWEMTAAGYEGGPNSNWCFKRPKM